jgi:NitT/TauT family transport system substrate-binding protein
MNKRQFLSWVGTFAVAAIATGCGPKSGDTGTSGTSGTNGAAGNASSAGATNSAGTSASAAGAPGAFEVQKATVGYLQNIVMPQPLIGIQEGAFAKAMPGVSFSGQSFPAGPAVMESLQSGKVDIAYTGPYPPLKAFIKNKDIVLLAAAGAGGTELLVGGKSGVKSVKDLKGKVVGVNQLGSTVDAMVRHVLIENGLKPTWT